MPLTYVVEHLNRQLRALHPQSALATQSRLRLDHQALSAEVNGIRIQPMQTLVYRVDNPQVVARDSRVGLQQNGRWSISTQALYLQAWDGADVVFLDRLLRTLQALHHVGQYPEVPTEPLILSVHPRHLKAVSADHGLIFEQLLSQLGLTPAQIILRLGIDPERADAHTARAITSFSRRGYGLLWPARTPALGPLGRVQALGFGWASLPAGALDAETLAWSRCAQGLGLQTLAEDVDHTQQLEQALAGRVALVEGRLLSRLPPGAWHRIGGLHGAAADDDPARGLLL